MTNACLALHPMFGHYAQDMLTDRGRVENSVSHIADTFVTNGLTFAYVPQSAASCVATLAASGHKVLLKIAVNCIAPTKLAEPVNLFTYHFSTVLYSNFKIMYFRNRNVPPYIRINFLFF